MFFQFPSTHSEDFAYISTERLGSTSERKAHLPRDSSTQFAVGEVSGTHAPEVCPLFKGRSMGILWPHAHPDQK